MKVGDLVIVLYEKKGYSLIVSDGPSSSTFVILSPYGTLRTLPRLELKVVEKIKSVDSRET